MAHLKKNTRGAVPGLAVHFERKPTITRTKKLMCRILSESRSDDRWF
ncbi:hypothetical protein [Leuconostoc sp. DB-1]